MIIFNLFLAFSSFFLIPFFIEPFVWRTNSVTVLVFRFLQFTSCFSNLIENHRHLDGIGYFTTKTSRNMSTVNFIAWIVTFVYVAFLLEDRGHLFKFLQSDRFIFLLVALTIFFIEDEGYLKRLFKGSEHWVRKMVYCASHFAGLFLASVAIGDAASDVFTMMAFYYR